MNNCFFWWFTSTIVTTIGIILATDCDMLQTKYGSVCRCTAEYCDYMKDPKPENNSTVVIISSSMNGLRFHTTKGVYLDDETIKIEDLSKNNDIGVRRPEDSCSRAILIDSGKTFEQSFDVKRTKFFVPNDRSVINSITINRSTEFQKILGFGGALTGSVSYILQNLDKKLQDHIYRSYFHSDGIRYNMLRLPIGGCDFDLTPWAYNEFPENDISLSNFTVLDDRDLIKIEQIERIKGVAFMELKIMAAAWSPPPWMKSNNKWNGYSHLKKEYYQTWADYHLRFLELMNAKNMTIWAISIGNEPLNGVIGWFFVHFMSLGWTPTDQAIYLDTYLGPTVRNSPFRNVLIFGNDDQRYTFPTWFQRMNSTRYTSLSYLDGLAVHWYWDDIFSPQLIDLTNEMMPGKLLLNTESCVGDKPWQTHGPELGSWQRAEQYAKALLQDFQHNFNGWIDWNLILNEYGGPNYVKNYVDSPIIVNTLNHKEFYKQPIFYILGHFSKFVPPESVRVEIKLVSTRKNIDAVAFKANDGCMTLIIFNSASMPQQVTLNDSERGVLYINIPARSIHTLLYR